MPCNAICSATYIPTYWRKLLPAYSTLKLGGSWFPQNACQSLVDDMCSKMVILTITGVGTSDLLNEYLFCKLSTMCHVYCQIFNLFIPAVLAEIYGKYGTVTKHSCIVAKLAYVFLY